MSWGAVTLVHSTFHQEQSLGLPLAPSCLDLLGHPCHPCSNHLNLKHRPQSIHLLTASTYTSVLVELLLLLLSPLRSPSTNTLGPSLRDTLNTLNAPRSIGVQTFSMKETSSDPPDIDSKRSRAIPKAHGVSSSSSPRQPHSPPNEPTLDPDNANNANNNANNNSVSNISNKCDTTVTHSRNVSTNTLPTSVAGIDLVDEKAAKHETGSVSTLSGHLAYATSLQDERQGSVVETSANQDNPSNNDSNDGTSRKKKRTVMQEARRTFWMVATYSWLNVLLVFVPIGIVVANVGGTHAGVVFAMNCIAVIPLAGLLAYATESVASNMGDALGALLNVTFGNAVELIIFIALVKNQIRIVQASLLGSILANLLLILGMGFFLGGLRYREQIYNSTVTQMSACLLSLSVISLVLPTAFHASFNNSALADKESLKISRGTSVILLLVYIIYLLFQLKSHAYMYESTPQHIVDAESIPGPAAAWLDSSSSDDSSLSSSDSDYSGHSRDTMRRKMKNVLRGGRRRKSSVTSTDTADTNIIRAGSFATVNASPNEEVTSEASSSRPQFLPSTETNEDVTEDEKPHMRSKRRRIHRHKKRKAKKACRHEDGGDPQPTVNEPPQNGPRGHENGEPRRVDFAVQGDGTAAEDSANQSGTPKRPFPTLRGMSVKNLAPTVFVRKPEAPGIPLVAPTGPVPRVRYGIRRTNSLPDRLSQYQFRPPGAMLPSQIPLMALTNAGSKAGAKDDDEHLTRTASIILLLLTTGLVAVCAEFLVGSIEDVVKTSSIGEIFIGLIILPIVGNAAEHVTAITVAMKNKMDLAIGVAVGSSIQIAIFVTPLIVILGWIIGRDMTLYFTLFETVSLFVSAFMVNFLVLDGRSNYLEGALLCAVYIIISIVAFFFPDAKQASQWGE
ncbi:Vacuolar calcium ion transporter [Tolypocladium ophioglossoides CBS 100239]|uniref:Vacuolar calcium ion transporter n=1 Tax=Tolypocladium ophioglossoides (strain CBS 100239) TaxID=1163406 RepID=A0A0L0NB53_TOLOC|nr:Vacuolar calcium ion transporter [Tolypocladium ophioglossoides CBS 100239]